MWVEINKESVFHYTEIAKLGPDALHIDNIPFILGIQTSWQKEMMLKFGQNSGVVIDATFETLAKKVLNWTSLQCVGF